MAAARFSYPLKSWSLAGFRAIKDKTDLELGGLNVLVGANSAGKSSVLHSILLAAQTLATPMADRSLVLNGTLVRLGLATDCVHEQVDHEIMLGFGLDPSELAFSRPAMGDLSLLEVKSRFVISDEDRTNFRLARTDVTAHLSEDSGSAQVSAISRTQLEAKEALEGAGADLELADEYANRVGLGVAGDVPQRTVGIYARQFLPFTLAVLVNSYRRELNDLLELWAPRLGDPGAPGVRRRKAISEPVAEFLRAFIKQLPDELSQLVPDGGDLSADALAELPPAVREEIATLYGSTWFAEHAEDLSFKGEVNEQLLIGVLDSGIDCARWWFSRNVRHLGPIRAMPRPLYSLPEAASGISVGQSGEYTAAVLSTYGKRMVSVPVPDGPVETIRLAKAVDLWVAELGLLSAVHAREQGKLGFELNVSMDGVERSLDLTTVGVGVSQALPIVVLGLITDPGSLLLFEQPELHLHPDVQAALGDFFLALARSGRQLIVETHSEYLISRLRRRQLTDRDSDAAELVRLFFFERHGSAAKVTAKQIGIDGDMPEWPRGFLDTAAREVEAMVFKDTS